MNFKKNIGAILLMVSAIIINVCPASFTYVGTEEMPESMKNLR